MMMSPMLIPTRNWIRGPSPVWSRHLLLNGNRAGHGIDRTGELYQHAVAGGLDYPAVILADCRIDDLAPVRFQGREGADLIGAHQPRVARDIGCKDGGKPAFDPRLGHLMPSDPA